MSFGIDFIVPSEEELVNLREDPLLWEQELDVRPEFARRLEQELQIRAGKVYWRSKHDHLYALELADLGRGRPSMAMVYGHWARYEPRPPEHEIDGDLLDFCLWAADTGGLNAADVAKVAKFAGVRTTWPEGSVLRTPEDRFTNLPDFPWEPRYVEVEGLRMAYVEQGEGDPVLLLHGEPTWSYLYRHMIPQMAKAGRVIAPDLIGFGRSDKPVAANAYSYKSHCRWLRGFIEALDLRRITLICQDWGGLLGLRILGQHPERFRRLVAMNTGIHDGRGAPEAFHRWRRFSQRVRELDVPRLMRASLRKHDLTDAEARAYQAPFPSREFQTAALVFPRLVPVRPDDPGVYENRMAIERLRTLSLPVLLPWGMEDPITTPSEQALRSIFRNAAPALIADAGHFVQEDAGEEIAGHIVRWMGQTG
ncbi:MAG TPA: haloalkane dehalogenase [Bryobacteraceae bacterium]|jgi:haloalkane dehalogenase|nr:haloalkane dehalogenase [Bryobacteraceae bacterium]